MKLIEYMKANGLDDHAMAAGLGGDVTHSQVKKWKYGETTPRLAKLLRIAEFTNREVLPDDFLTVKTEKLQ